MKKGSKKIIIGVSVLLFLAVLFVGFFSGWFGLFKQTVYGNSPDKVSCTQYMKDNLCTEGYKCYACKDKGNGFWGADCYLNSGVVPVSSDACKLSSSVTSHAYYQCYSGDVYYYDSTGKREDRKSSCGYGCSDNSLKTASCKTGSNVGGVCMPNTNKLCSSAVYVSGNYYCDVDNSVDCPNGCSNGACKSNVIIPVVNPECDASFVQECNSANSYKWCNEQEGKIRIFTCLPNWECVIGAGVDTLRNGGDNCVPKDVITPSVIVDPCLAANCLDYMDSSGTSFSGGSCNVYGDCVYAVVKTADPICPVNGVVVGSSCGENKIWESSGMQNNCATFECVELRTPPPVSSGIPLIFWYVLGGIIIIVGFLIMNSKKK